MEEKSFADYTKATTHPQRGINGHIMFGHGPTQGTFEKRDFCTTNEIMYEQREKVETLINPNNF